MKMTRSAKAILALFCLSLLSVLTLSVSASATPSSFSTQFCGDRYGACAGAAVREVRHFRWSSKERHIKRHPTSSIRAGGYLTVPTAAGINVTLAPGFAARAQQVIADLVAGGYKPRKISGLNFGRGHVAGSLHFSARAVDVDQCGWGCSPVPKILMRTAVARAGLRDGCEFGDHGHFDNGPHLPRARVIRTCGVAYADAIEPGVAANLLLAHHRPSLYEAVADFKTRAP